MYSKGIWSTEEHERFLQALRANPHASWLEMSEVVATRSPRQVQSHAQKYNAKINRHARGLRKVRRHLTRKEHRIERASKPDADQHPTMNQGTDLLPIPHELRIEYPVSATLFTKRKTLSSLPTFAPETMMELLSFEPAADVSEDYFEFLLPLLTSEGASPSGVEMEVYMTYV